jgi:hypothetical protein
MNPLSSVTSIGAVSSAPQYAAAGTSTPSTSTASQSTPEDSVNLSLAATRELLQTGRIGLDAQAGRLNGDQVSQLESQEASVYNTISADKQANGGQLTTAEKQSINQQQTQISYQIWSEANGATVSNPSAPAVPTPAAGS